MAFGKDKSQKFFELENKKNLNINQTFDKGIKKINIKDENEVEIDGEIFEKTTQFNLITKKVLEKCKVYVNKNGKRKKIMKAGDRKNMMKKGMHPIILLLINIKLYNFFLSIHSDFFFLINISK